MTAPITPKTPRTSDKDKIDIGKQRGFHDTPELREKVLKWQTPTQSPSQRSLQAAPSPQGAVLPGAEDIKKKENSGAKNTPADDNEKVYASPSKPDFVVPTSDDFDLAQDLKAASAPRKRVVSDDHWRKARSSPQQTTGSPQNKLSPVKKTDEALYVREGSTKIEGWARRKTTPIKSQIPVGIQIEKSPLALGSANQRKTSAQKQVAVCDAEVKISPAPRKPPVGNEQAVVPRANTPRKTSQKHEERVLTPKPAVVVKHPLDPPVLALEVPKRDKSSTRRTSPSPRSLPEEKRSSERRRVLSHEKKPTRDSAEKDNHYEPIVPPNSGNRIQTWLTDTKDPFLDSESEFEEEAAASPISMAGTGHMLRPRALSVRRVTSRRRTYTYHVVDKPPAEEATRYTSRTTRAYSDLTTQSPQRIPSRSPDYFSSQNDYDDEEVTITDLDTDSVLSSPTTPTLRRRGARRKSISPKKNAHFATDEPSEASRASILSHNRSNDEEASSPAKPQRPNVDQSTLWSGRHAVLAQPQLSLTAPGKLSSFSSTKEHAQIRKANSSAHLEPSTAQGSPKSELDENKVIGNTRPTALRKMTSHADLMSVLSMPDHDARSLKPARSIRSGRSKAGAMTLAEVIEDLSEDEEKYIRELRTMVDGVIPVLLNCVLSKANSTLASNLFSTVKADTDVSAPIVSIGVALERLKSAHQRMPKTTADSLLLWAQGSCRIYEDFLQAWRLGFQDVVVNLAPAADNGTAHDKSKSPWNGTLSRDDDGYIVNEQGGKVDVAYLLKRPLVRLKYLARTLKDIEKLAPSTQASLMANKFQELVSMAKRRQDEERARLEDEAAANIDSSHIRDPRTLNPLTGIKIDRSRCVKARDMFTLKFQHSNGQRIDCGVELILRENPPGLPNGGDVLICELDSTLKWLLLPPVNLNKISARAGEHDDEVTVMIRGNDMNGLEWFELLVLRANDPRIKDDWIQLLGSKPYPPDAALGGSLWSEHGRGEDLQSLIPINSKPVRSENLLTSERPLAVRTSSFQLPNRSIQIPGASGIQPVSQEPQPSPSALSDPGHRSNHAIAYQNRGNDHPRSAREVLATGQDNRFAPTESPLARQSPYPSWSRPDDPPPPPSHRSSSPTSDDRSGRQGASWSQWRQASPTRSTVSQVSNQSAWLPKKGDYIEDSDDEAQQGWFHNRTIQLPRMDCRTANEPLNSPPSSHSELHTLPQPISPQQPATPTIRRKEVPSPVSRPSPNSKGPVQESGLGHANPQTPSARSPRHPSHSASRNSPRTPVSSNHRRPSSPLKREYLPSSDSDASSAIGDIHSGDNASITSDSSADDTYGNSPFARGFMKTRPQSGTDSPKAAPTLTPSQSASQGPCRSLSPQQEAPLSLVASIFSWADRGAWEIIHPTDCSIFITPGLIEAHEMTAAHSAQMNTSASPSSKPLVALELTPLVPLRRGTALDITIRSPPTPNSTFRKANNIMFRSRNAQECDTLYNLINQARINNPTYIALQEARNPSGAGGGNTWAAYMDKRANARSSNSAWWRFSSKRSSYRKSGAWRSNALAGSSVTQTADSGGSMTSKSAAAVAALKRFTSVSGNKVFSVSKSTVSSRGRVSGSSTTFTSSSGSGYGSGGVDGGDRAVSRGGRGGDSTPIGVGIANALKVRLYERETAGKWRDMGAARLTIMNPPPTLSSATTFSPNSTSSLALPGANASLSPMQSRSPSGTYLPNAPHQTHTTIASKRIHLTSSSHNAILLDVTLPETSFERVARTGIAVSVWQELIREGVDGQGWVGEAASTGGVVAGRGKVYMLQLRSEAEAAWVFGLVGRLRY